MGRDGERWRERDGDRFGEMVRDLEMEIDGERWKEMGRDGER